MALARIFADRKLKGRRTSSSLSCLVRSCRPVAKTLNVTPRIVSELGLREMRGRGRFRAWGILEDMDVAVGSLARQVTPWQDTGRVRTKLQFPYKL